MWWIHKIYSVSCYRWIILSSLAPNVLYHIIKYKINPRSFLGLYSFIFSQTWCVFLESWKKIFISFIYKALIFLFYPFLLSFPCLIFLSFPNYLYYVEEPGIIFTIISIELVVLFLEATNKPSVNISPKFFKFKMQKQPFRGVPRKKCSENMQAIYRRTPMPKCDFTKVVLRLYWNHTSAWVFSCAFAVYFQNTFL